MSVPQRGEVWMVDLGLAAKVRPCLVLSIPAEGEERSLVTLIPHTTSVRISRFEMGSSLLLAQLDNKNHQYKSPADRASPD